MTGQGNSIPGGRKTKFKGDFKTLKYVHCVKVQDITSTKKRLTGFLLITDRVS